ncbi:MULTISPECIES: alpha/beta hydrolase-fold protein [unclassified Imperialibacter]|uniref:alpha/beta hydrolase-fold protein n=1 Tax=unclassified Imperialibacter TaxID=2629706 RepID=UPI001255DAD2|nr:MULTISPECIES: alpha/beta hydrolase-fold protein [unclassified Imperialibacter]CAD5289840.1 conserved hypothetical protein [Imperialibacter sp. 89]CAD5290110.1 conserved hypothetical protein [Imperialibacter sp. 75]VVT34528.1 conserved hypothetical protein [Imperialibacter sp. EC-SDR9]
MYLRVPFILIGFCGFFSCFSQSLIRGKVVDAADQESLAFVNIGIAGKNIGTTSAKDGSFAIKIPQSYFGDSLTFSMVGYFDVSVPISNLKTNLQVMLNEKTTTLSEVFVLGEKLIERTVGIRKRGLIHFTDGIFQSDDAFEIGQVIRLGDHAAQITGLNLHVNSNRPDSASFRINFYRYDGAKSQPVERVFEKSVFQRHAIIAGWLHFDLKPYNIILTGDVLAAVEFIPEGKPGIAPIYYEVKLGGTSKSFYRGNSLGSWNRPPHHYCLNVAVLIDKSTPEVDDDLETLPTFVMKSAGSGTVYNLFVRLPLGYDQHPERNYPVVYLLDGNAYFDPISSTIDGQEKKKKQAEVILIGIGYKDAYLMDSLRNRDYTFPTANPADSFPLSGGGHKFHQFITDELVPYVQKNYRTTPSNNSLMGHSLGGYFVLYALLQNLQTGRQSTFSHYVAASPSLWYGEEYLFTEFQALPVSVGSNSSTQVYMTLGAKEEDLGRRFETFGQLLKSQSSVEVKLHTFKGLEHMGAAIPAFEEGLTRHSDK